MVTVERIKLAYNNIYVARDGADVTVVDPGPDYAGAVGLIAARLSVSPDLVVATHGHVDHAGLGAYWINQGASVAIGAADDHLTGGPAPHDENQFDDMAEFVRTCGAPEEVVAEAQTGLAQRRAWAHRAATDEAYPPGGPAGRWPTGLRFQPFAANRILHDGEPLPGGLRVLDCPGHTPGNLVLTCDSEGWLFSGDQLLPEITPTPAIQHLSPADVTPGSWRFRSLPAFVASLRKLRHQEFARCFPGHGEPFDNVREVIDANLAQIEDRTERVASILRHRDSASLYSISHELYPRALRRRFWQITATVQGHLDLLEDAGRASFDGGNYAATSAT